MLLQGSQGRFPNLSKNRCRINIGRGQSGNFSMLLRYLLVSVVCSCRVARLRGRVVSVPIYCGRIAYCVYVCECVFLSAFRIRGERYPENKSKILFHSPIQRVLERKELDLRVKVCGQSCLCTACINSQSSVLNCLQFVCMRGYWLCLKTVLCLRN